MTNAWNKLTNAFVIINKFILQLIGCVKPRFALRRAVAAALVFVFATTSIGGHCERSEAISEIASGYALAMTELSPQSRFENGDSPSGQSLFLPRGSHLSVISLETLIIAGAVAGVAAAWYLVRMFYSRTHAKRSEWTKRFATPASLENLPQNYSDAEGKDGSKARKQLSKLFKERGLNAEHLLPFENKALGGYAYEFLRFALMELFSESWLTKGRMEGVDFAKFSDEAGGVKVYAYDILFTLGGVISNGLLRGRVLEGREIEGLRTAYSVIEKSGYPTMQSPAASRARPKREGIEAFLMEFYVMYVRDGAGLRKHINSVGDEGLRQAWISVYMLFRKKVFGGREFYHEGKDFAELRGIEAWAQAEVSRRLIEAVASHEITFKGLSDYYAYLSQGGWVKRISSAVRLDRSMNSLLGSLEKEFGFEFDKEFKKGAVGAAVKRLKPDTIKGVKKGDIGPTLKSIVVLISAGLAVASRIFGWELGHLPKVLLGMVLIPRPTSGLDEDSPEDKGEGGLKGEADRLKISTGNLEGKVEELKRKLMDIRRTLGDKAKTEEDRINEALEDFRGDLKGRMERLAGMRDKAVSALRDKPMDALSARIEEALRRKGELVNFLREFVGPIDNRDIVSGAESSIRGLDAASDSLDRSNEERKRAFSDLGAARDKLETERKDAEESLRALDRLSEEAERLNGERKNRESRRRLKDFLGGELAKKDAANRELGAKAQASDDAIGELERARSSLSVMDSDALREVERFEQLLQKGANIEQLARRYLDDMAAKRDLQRRIEALELEMLPFNEAWDALVGQVDDIERKRGTVDQFEDSLGLASTDEAIEKFSTREKPELKGSNEWKELAIDRIELDRLLKLFRNELDEMRKALERAQAIKRAAEERRRRIEEFRARGELEALERALLEDRIAREKERIELENLMRLEREHLERMEALKRQMDERKQNIEKNLKLLDELLAKIEGRRVSGLAGQAIGEATRKAFSIKKNIPDWDKFRAQLLEAVEEIVANIPRDKTLGSELVELHPVVENLEASVKAKDKNKRVRITSNYRKAEPGIQPILRRALFELREAQARTVSGGLKSTICAEVNEANSARQLAHDRWSDAIITAVDVIGKASEENFEEARERLASLCGIAKESSSWVNEDERRLKDLRKQKEVLEVWDIEIDAIIKRAMESHPEAKGQRVPADQMGVAHTKIGPSEGAKAEEARVEEALPDFIRRRRLIAKMLGDFFGIPHILDGPIVVSIGRPSLSSDRARWMSLFAGNIEAQAPVLSDAFVYSMLKRIKVAEKEKDASRELRERYYVDAGIDKGSQITIERFLKEFERVKQRGSRAWIVLEVAERLGITDAERHSKLRVAFRNFETNLREATRDYDEGSIRDRMRIEEEKNIAIGNLIKAIETIAQPIPLAAAGKGDWLTDFVRQYASLSGREPLLARGEVKYPPLSLNDESRERLLSIVFGMQAQEIFFGDNGLRALLSPGRSRRDADDPITRGWIKDALSLIQKARTDSHKKFKEDNLKGHLGKGNMIDWIYVKIHGMDGSALDILKGYLDRISKYPECPISISGD